ncbi:MAG: XTP/dITP diphosphatase [Candidatus Bathyarchaeota archaeon]|nr:XTP/dITP diphosphatase [Candidatus Bathyarchaeota archaeon]
MSLKGKVAFFVTTNFHKFNEARQLLVKAGVAVALLKLEAIEIQDDNLEKIAAASVRDAVKKSRLPVLVEDSGLFIEAVKGFPGPYSSQAYRTLGTKGILKLMRGITERNAYFYSVVAFHSPERASPKCFHGKVEGRITLKERGDQGFGFDPIFAPKGGSDKTLAKMTTTEKNKISHRGQALGKFAVWYTSTYNKGFKYG